MPKFPLKMNLQLFAGDADLLAGLMSDLAPDDGDDTDYAEGGSDSGADNDGDDGKGEASTGNEDFSELDEGEDLDESDYEDKEDPQTEDKPKDQKPTETQEAQAPVKPTQTPEQNAQFAEQRRQRQLEEALKQRPEYQLAQELSALYEGQTPEQLLANIREARLKKSAEAQGVPVEVLRQQQAQAERIKALEAQQIDNEYKAWERRMEDETAAIKAKHTFLSDDDIVAARSFMLGTLKNVNVPLESVVYMVHGEKIAKEMARIEAEEIKAQIAGRTKKSPIIQKGDKTNSDNVLTAEERAMMKNFKMTEEQWLKWKR